MQLFYFRRKTCNFFFWNHPPTVPRSPHWEVWMQIFRPCGAHIPLFLAFLRSLLTSDACIYRTDLWFICCFSVYNTGDMSRERQIRAKSQQLIMHSCRRRRKFCEFHTSVMLAWTTLQLSLYSLAPNLSWSEKVATLFFFKVATIFGRTPPPPTPPRYPGPPILWPEGFGAFHYPMGFSQVSLAAF